MLKLLFRSFWLYKDCQPPSGGCVLKQCLGCGGLGIDSQPPSGGCVLKLIVEPNIPPRDKPAAFRRLCVETVLVHQIQFNRTFQPPSGGCVLKLIAASNSSNVFPQPPSGGCVLKQPFRIGWKRKIHPAAFRRLCVETR